MEHISYNTSGTCARKIEIDVENDRKRGRKIEEGIHVFTRFKNEVIARTADPTGRASEIGELRTAEHRGVNRLQENMRTHRGTGALSVHSRNADAVTVSHHQISQIVRTGDHGNSAFHRRHVFGIVFSDRNGIDHRIVSRQMLCRMPAKDLYTESGKVLGLRIVVTVGSTHAVSLQKRDLRQRRHTDATDSDKKQAVTPLQALLDQSCPIMRIFKRHTVVSPLLSMIR